MKIVDANANIPRSYDNPSTAQVLERWSSGYRPGVTPPPHTMDNGTTLSNRLDNGTTDDLPGIHKKAVCASGRNAIHFGRLSRVDRPSDPLARWRGGWSRKQKPLFL